MKWKLLVTARYLGSCLQIQNYIRHGYTDVFVWVKHWPPSGLLLVIPIFGENMHVRYCLSPVKVQRYPWLKVLQPQVQIKVCGGSQRDRQQVNRRAQRRPKMDAIFAIVRWPFLPLTLRGLDEDICSFYMQYWWILLYKPCCLIISTVSIATGSSEIDIVDQLWLIFSS